MMNKTLLTAVAVLAATTGLSATAQVAADGQVLGSYDPATGNVFLDVGSGNGNVALANFGGPLLFEIEDFDSSTSLGEALATSTAVGNLDIFFSLTDDSPAGVFNIGDVLPAGLSLGDLAQIFSVGGTGNSFNPLTVVVPEPASLALLGLGGLALATRRRRA